MTIKIEQLFQIKQLLSDIQNNKPGQDLMDQFLELVRTGELQYRDIPIKHLPDRYIHALIQNELFLEEMAESREVELHAKLVANGAKSEYYEIWKDSYDPDIRRVLAEYGYFPETFINDADPRVRMSALKRNPQYLPYYFKDESLYDYISAYYVTQQNPNIEQFEMFLLVNDRKVKQAEITSQVKLADVIHIKKASEREATTIEQTMTVTQLYDTGSPLWAKDLTLDDVYEVMWKESTNKSLEDIHTFIQMQLARASGE